MSPAALLALVLLSAAPQGRVLPPQAGEVVQRAFARLEPALRMRSARIERDRVRAVLCAGPEAAEQACFTVHLGDPSEGCEGERSGPWCVTFPEGSSVMPAQAGAVYRALAPDREEEVWQGEPSGAGGAYALMAVLGLAPLLLGLALGLLAGARVRGWLGRLLAALVPCAAGFALVPVLPRVGSWDLIASGVGLGLGFVAGSALRGASWRAWVSVACGAALSLALLEGGAWLLLPRPPASPPPAEARLTFTPEELGQGCTALYPERYAELLSWRFEGAREARWRVLHLGDSMVHGTGVGAERAFPALLTRRRPEVFHVNGGFPGVGTDCHLLVVRAWGEVMPVDLVVLHVFLGNDVVEMDRAYVCCADGPLLAYDGGLPRARCPEPRWRFPLPVLLARSPAPYPLRVATGFSTFARHAVPAWAALAPRNRVRRDGIDQGGLGQASHWAHFEAALRGIRDELARRGTPLAVTLLPYRRALEAAEPASTPSSEVRRRVREIAGRLGLSVLDAWDLFFEAVRADGAGRWFSDRVPGDVHFSAEGHERFARWLEEQLTSRGMAPWAGGQDGAGEGG